MEKLHEIAEAYYDAVPAEIKEKVKIFFKAMDTNSDNEVSEDEFLNFMNQGKYEYFSHSDLFKKLCRGNKNYLDFMDVKTLFYIIRSGRPFCKVCAKFIEDVYFCCIICFDDNKREHCLCLKCYKAKRYTKNSDHRHQFVDNFTLLELKRSEGSSYQASSSHTKPYYYERNSHEEASSYYYERNYHREAEASPYYYKRNDERNYYGETSPYYYERNYHEENSHALVPAREVGTEGYGLKDVVQTLEILTATANLLRSWCAIQ